MTITLSFKKFRGNRPQIVTIDVANQLTLEQLRLLWEFETFINNLPTNVRLWVSAENNVPKHIPESLSND